MTDAAEPGETLKTRLDELKSRILRTTDASGESPSDGLDALGWALKLRASLKWAVGERSWMLLAATPGTPDMAALGSILAALGVPEESRRPQIRGRDPGGSFVAACHWVDAVDTKKEVGRNDPCPCGSAKKWKKCHGR